MTLIVNVRLPTLVLQCSVAKLLPETRNRFLGSFP